MNCDVSVIIPVYNSSGTLRRALDSVFSQTLLPREILVVDDGSDDWEESKLIVASYPSSICVHFIRCEKNGGAGVARNAGLKAASCRYIAFLDSDDVWFKNKLKIQHGMMACNRICFSAHGYVADLSHLRGEAEETRDVTPLCSSFSSWSLLYKNYSTPTVMVLREKMVPFDPFLRRNEDWKCWMEVFSKSDLKGVYIRHALAGGFKPSIGASGLSYDVKKLHASRIIALKRLIDGDKISIVQYLVGICTEQAKYPLRVILLARRRRA
jgi:glycosyltransferase involved in cell wall biosynthesis